MLQAWAGTHLLSLDLSGSFAKGTAISGGTDVDIFISLANSAPGTLRDLYTGLAAYVRGSGYSPQLENVAIRIRAGNFMVDLVPGKKHLGYTQDHSLYLRRRNSWIQTNVARHIAYVTNSNRVQEIRLMKIWRKVRRIDFPSFFLELAVIEALRGHAIGNLTANIKQCFEYISSQIVGARLVDPANTNNIVSDDLTPVEKSRLAQQAALALQAPINQVLR